MTYREAEGFVPAQELARDLHLSVSDLLARCDESIERITRNADVEAVRGLTTVTHKGHAFVSPELATLLRKDGS
jgi:hypothetical protein